MPRSSMLSADEQIEIRAYANTGMSGSAIAVAVNRSKDVVCHFLRDPEEYNRQKHRGRKPKVSPTAVRRLFREASSGDKSARQLCEDLELPVGVSRVQQLLRNSSYFSYEKRAASPWMTKRHKEERVKWACSMLEANTE